MLKYRLGGILMNIESLTSEIMERFNYYEKRRFGCIEASCLNLEKNMMLMIILHRVF